MSLPLQAEIFLPPNAPAVTAPIVASAPKSPSKIESTDNKNGKRAPNRLDSRSVRETVLRIGAAIIILTIAATAVFMSIHLKESNNMAILSLVGNYSLRFNPTETPGDCYWVDTASDTDSIMIEPLSSMGNHQNLHLRLSGLTFVTNSSTNCSTADVELELSPVDGLGRRFTSFYFDQRICITREFFGLVLEAPDSTTVHNDRVRLCARLGNLQCTSGPCSDSSSMARLSVFSLILLTLAVLLSS